MLNLYKLEIFAIVVAEGSFSAAADHLYMTQSAVSQHMQDLERSLGATLFKRGRRGVTLTTSGEKLYFHTQQILRQVAQAENDVMDVKNLAEGAAKIGASPTVGIYLLPEWVRHFRNSYSNLSLSLETATTPAILQDVLRQRLEIGIVEGEIDQNQYPALGMATLRDINMIMIIGPDHPWWDKDHVVIEDLHQQPFAMRQPDSQTRKWLDSLLAKHNIMPMITAEFDNPESIKQSVVNGQCLTVLPDFAVQREVAAGIVRMLNVEGITFTRTLKLLWYDLLPMSPIARAFVDILKAEFPSLQPQLAG